MNHDHLHLGLGAIMLLCVGCTTVDAENAQSTDTAEVQPEAPQEKTLELPTEWHAFAAIIDKKFRAKETALKSHIEEQMIDASYDRLGFDRRQHDLPALVSKAKKSSFKPYFEPACLQRWSDDNEVEVYYLGLRVLDSNHAVLDFRFYEDKHIDWCSYEVSKQNGTIVFTDLILNNRQFRYSDVIDMYVQLSMSPAIHIDFQDLGKKDKETFEMAYRGGFSRFTRYLKSVDVDLNQPVIRDMRYEMAQAIPGKSVQTKLRKQFFNLDEVSDAFPLAQMQFMLQQKDDLSHFQKGINNSIAATHDPSGVYYTACLTLYQSERLEQATEQCKKAILLDPSFDRPYFQLFEILNDQENFADAVLVLQTLVERFGYQFERGQFTSWDNYRELVLSDPFKDWL